MAGTVRKNTIYGYRMYANTYIKPILGNKTVSSITQYDVQKMYAKLKKEGRVHEHPQYGHALSDAMVRRITPCFTKR